MRFRTVDRELAKKTADHISKRPIGGSTSRKVWSKTIMFRCPSRRRRACSNMAATGCANRCCIQAGHQLYKTAKSSRANRPSNDSPFTCRRSMARGGRVGRLAEALAALKTALARLLNNTATAESGEAGHQAVAGAATATAGVLGRRGLLVLHTLRGAVLALRRTVLTLGRAVLTLRGTVALLGMLRIALLLLVAALVVILVGHVEGM